MTRAERRRMERDLKKGRLQTREVPEYMAGVNPVSEALLRQNVYRDVMKTITAHELDEYRLRVEYNRAVDEVSKFYGRIYAMLFVMEMRGHRISAQRAHRVFEGVMDRVQRIDDKINSERGYTNDEIMTDLVNEGAIMGLDFTSMMEVEN